MKNNFSLFLVLLFLGSYYSLAQENNNYLNVMAGSLPSKYVKSTKNLFFTVQIGAYKSKNIALQNIQNIVISNDEDNLTKYRLGEFPTYKEAVEFKIMLLSVCKDAFIVPIKNRKRIHILEVLENISF